MAIIVLSPFLSCILKGVWKPGYDIYLYLCVFKMFILWHILMKMGRKCKLYDWKDNLYDLKESAVTENVTSMT